MIVNKHRGRRVPLAESQEQYAKIENARIKKQNKTVKTNGLRKEFIDLFENSNISVSEAIEQFTLKHKVYKKKDLIIWLREELENGQISNQGLIKIKSYLDGLQNNEQKNNIENGER